MTLLQEVIVLLWCAVSAKAFCSNDTVCVAIQNGSETECQHHYPTVYKLSDLTVNKTSCKTVRIYLTSGTHILDRELFLSDSVQETEIHGAPHGPPSIIECQNNSGIRFSENESANKILISDVVFLHCQRKLPYFYYGYRDIISLYLRNAMYALSSVIINNTVRQGLVSENCSQQIIFNCTFSSNISLYLGLLSSHNSNVNITHSTFNSGAEISCYYCNNVSVVLQSSTFCHAIDNVGLHLQNVSDVEITDCLFANNKFVALLVDPLGYRTVISKVIFQNNARAIYLIGGENNNEQIQISECSFTNHTGNWVIRAKNMNRLTVNRLTVIIQNSSFQRNKAFDDLSCSILDIQSTRNFTLSDVHIADNNCTGITIDNAATTIFIQNSVNLTRNHGLLGGGLCIKDYRSYIVFAKSSKLSLINNTADAFGGGIYYSGREICYNFDECFLRQFESGNIAFSGNSAGQGGDAVFGGCLSSCYTNGRTLLINKCDRSNTLWDLVPFTSNVSQSTFVEAQRRLMFCTNSSTSGASCSNVSDSVNVYRGQKFNVSLMVADTCCFPSAELIEARVKHSQGEGQFPLQLKHDSYQMGKKYCHNFSYVLIGLGPQEMTATVEFKSHFFAPPALLTVHLKECPTGYELNHESGECGCKSILKKYKIECHPNNASLLIPAHTWVGKSEEESGSIIVVQNDCQYCKSEEVLLMKTRGSHFLCIANRNGVMCGACIPNYSLQLGGYECADCSNFTYKGVLLLIAFTIIGIALVLLLLGLNLTVSTGMINGLIYYSNIVYLNSDTLLPTTREGNSTHLQNTVRILSTFQAWMNLDFGIVTCFFDGYDTYISTWMQFVFPLYIWSLILIIVLANRFSNRISKITPSNTVSVLATLLLLSYAKLLKTSIEAVSSVQLQLLGGNMTNKLWKPDANIPYLGQLHLPLFLMSVLIVMIYVVPFTLLILLGPLLQAKSHYRVLNWINKLKPFLDAFYGPYTNRYRYWPGILLLSRFVILIAFAIYSSSTNDVLFKLLIVSLMSTVLLVMWLAIGKINAVSLNQKYLLNYLELFLLLNLSIFAALSTFYTSSGMAEEIKQGLAVAMVGSVLALSCGIIGYQIFSKCKEFIPSNIFKRKNTLRQPRNPLPKQEDISNKTTHSLVEITECSTPNNQLREPLLLSDVHES